MDLTGALPRDPQLTYCDEPHPDDPEVQCLREQEVGRLHAGLHCVPGTQIFWGQVMLLTKPERNKVKGEVMEGIDIEPATPAPTSDEVLPARPPDGDRDGATYEQEFDYERLNAQAQRVFSVMGHGGWHTLKEIEEATGDPQASISARLRDLRKPEFGALNIERRARHREQGVFEYRINFEAVPAQPLVVAGLRDFG